MTSTLGGRKRGVSLYIEFEREVELVKCEGSVPKISQRSECYMMYSHMSVTTTGLETWSPSTLLASQV